MTSRTRANASRKKTLSLPANVLLGIQSLVDGNERIIGYMLGSENSENLVDELVDCMRVNNLSAEMLLARFFDGKILSEYSEKKLGKSGKGSAATLSARIAREWAKPTFSVATNPPPTQTAMSKTANVAVKSKHRTPPGYKAASSHKKKIKNLTRTVKRLKRAVERAKRMEEGAEGKALEIMESLAGLKVNHSLVKETGLAKAIGKISKCKIERLKALAKTLKREMLAQLDRLDGDA